MGTCNKRDAQIRKQEKSTERKESGVDSHFGENQKEADKGHNHLKLLENKEKEAEEVASILC